MNALKEIKLNPIWERRYKNARFLVYLVFILLIIYAGYLVLFPSANFVFSFKNPDSLKNTVADPRKESGEPIRNGQVEGDKKMIFDANLVGDFSEARVNFTLTGKSENVEDGSVSVRKSFRSFFYPNGDAITKINIPQLFKIDNDYYQLKDNILYRFVSEKAYLSNYDSEQASAKDENFLKSYPLSEEFFGFRDGTLLSSDISVFVVSGNKIWPINNPITFISSGWNWNDVIVASGEEIGIYQKEKLFTIKTPQPDGTLFRGNDTGKYYLISNGEKHELIGKDVIDFYSKINPLLAEEKNLEIEEECNLAGSFGLSKRYSCIIPIDNMKDLSGDDFEFQSFFGNDIDVQNISVTFKKKVSVENLKSSLSTLKSRTLLNYGQSQ
ncbi:MAG: hypothetical protein WC906_00390 [Parcubacteria group bacterium]|jgi:hypothetical protein